MLNYKKSLLIIFAFSVISCGKNDRNNEVPLVNTEQKRQLGNEQKLSVNSEIQKNDSIYQTAEDSKRETKESVLKNKYKKKKQIVTADGKIVEIPKIQTIPNEPVTQKTVVPSFVYIKKILKDCKIGVPMTQKELKTNYNIPEEGIQLVKSLTKISENELDVKWKSTWLIEKMSDAKFKDGLLKVRFDKNKMYTSGGAIAIKYEKKMYTDLILIGRSAYIPTVKGFYWQIGKD
jgi:hypothetical protein